MSKQLLQAAVNAKGTLEAVVYYFDGLGLDSLEGMTMDQCYIAIEQLNAAISIAQRQEQMQAADTHEAQFAPESFDSAEGSPICDTCGCEMQAWYDDNERIVGYDCPSCVAPIKFVESVDSQHLKALAYLRREWRL